MTNPVGDLLKRWRTEQGESLRGLSSRAGLDPGSGHVYLHQVENGSIQQPGYQRMKAICEALGHSVNELFEEVENQKTKQTRTEPGLQPIEDDVAGAAEDPESTELWFELEHAFESLRRKKVQLSPDKLRNLVYLIKGAIAVI